MPKRILLYSRTQPARTIIAVVAWLTFLGGLVIFTPFYVPSTIGPAASAAFNYPILIGGAVNAIVSLPAMWAVWKNKPNQLARGALWLFVWYLFVSLVRVFFSPLGSVAFLPTLAIALIMAILYIEQSWVVKHPKQATGVSHA